MDEKMVKIDANVVAKLLLKAVGIVVGMLFVLFGAMVWPIASSILIGLVLSVIFVPVADNLEKISGVGQKTSSRIILFMILCSILSPLFYSGYKMISPTASVVSAVASATDSKQRLAWKEKINQTIVDASDRYPQYRQWFMQLEGAIDDTQAVLMGMGTGKLLTGASGTMFSFFNTTAGVLFTLLMHIVVGLTLMSFCLINRKSIGRYARLALPVDEENQDKIIDSFVKTMQAVSKGMLLNGLIQGGTGIIVIVSYMLITGQGNLWSGIVFSILLFVGSVFSMPVSALGIGICAFIEFSHGHMPALVILVIFVFVAMSVDSIPKKIVGNSIGFGFICTMMMMALGVKLFGPIGCMVGPALFKGIWVITAFVLEQLELYHEIFNQKKEALA